MLQFLMASRGGSGGFIKSEFKCDNLQKEVFYVQTLRKSGQSNTDLESR